MQRQFGQHCGIKGKMFAALIGAPAAWFSGMLHVNVGNPLPRGLYALPRYPEAIVFQIENGRVMRRWDLDVFDDHAPSRPGWLARLFARRA